MIRPVFLLTSFFLLSGCATTDWAAINKQVSDTAANLTKTLGGNDSGESGGMPLMSRRGNRPCSPSIKRSPCRSMWIPRRPA